MVPRRSSCTPAPCAKFRVRRTILYCSRKASAFFAWPEPRSLCSRDARWPRDRLYSVHSGWGDDFCRGKSPGAVYS
jgi:hypothetical protein